jgi:hypothetical protein
MLRGLAAARDTTGTNRPGAVSAGSESSGEDQSGAVSGPVAAPDLAIPVEEGSELAVSQASPDSEAEPAREPPRPLTEPELALLSGLESFITTPRDAKRLFNLYRMLRSTRDLSPASTFLGDDDTPGEYQAVAVLLGMLTAGARLFGQAMDATPQEHPPVGGGLSYRPATDSWRGFAADLAPRQQPGDMRANQVIGTIPADEVAGWHRFAAAVIRASALVTHRRAPFGIELRQHARRDRKARLASGARGLLLHDHRRDQYGSRLRERGQHRSQRRHRRRLPVPQHPAVVIPAEIGHFHRGESHQCIMMH